MVRWRPRKREAEAREQRGEVRRILFGHRKFQEHRARHVGRWGQRDEIGERRLGAAARQRLAGGEQRAHAVDGDAGGRGAAELLVEDLQRNRAAIARAQHRVEIVDDGVLALPRVAAVVAAQRHRVHQQRRRVGNLREGDFVGRQIGDRRDRIAAHADVETVEHNPEIGSIRLGDDLPRVGPVLDVATPGQRLVADAQAVLAREIGEVGEVGGDLRAVAERVLGDAGAQAEQRRAEFAGELQLALGAVELPAPAGRRGALEIAQRL